MGKRLIIHAGPAKSGTTTLQDFCAAHRDPLLEAGILYPQFARARAHHALAQGLIESWNFNGRLQAFERLIEQSEQTAHDTILLSAEGFALAIQTRPWRMEDFLQFWEARDYEVSIAAIIRPQRAMFESFYAQRVKSLHSSCRFAEHVRRELATSDLWTGAGLLQRSAPFRDRHFVFLPLNAELSAGLIEGFFAGLGLGGRLAAIPAEALTSQQNIRPSAKRIEVCRRLSAKRTDMFGPAPAGAFKWDWNRLGPMLGRVQEIEAQSGWMDQPFRALTDALAARIDARWSDVEEAFASREWGQSWESVFGPPAPIPEPTEFDPRHASAADKAEIREALRDALSIKPDRAADDLRNRPGPWPRGPMPVSGVLDPRDGG